MKPRFSKDEKAIYQGELVTIAFIHDKDESPIKSLYHFYEVLDSDGQVVKNQRTGRTKLIPEYYLFKFYPHPNSTRFNTAKKPFTIKAIPYDFKSPFLKKEKS